MFDIEVVREKAHSKSWRVWGIGLDDLEVVLPSLLLFAGVYLQLAAQYTLPV
jgi:hypothetical protein